MNSSKIRKEVTLDVEIIERLKVLALEEGRSLKNYMEKTLKEKASHELTEQHKDKLDLLIEKFENGKMNFLTEEEFKSKIRRK